MAPLSRFYAVMGAPAATRHRTLRGHVGPSGSDALMDFTKGAFTRDSVATFHTGLPTHSPGELLTRYGIDARRMRPGGGIFMEGARTNLVVSSNAAVSQANGTLTSNVALAPDGVTVDADLFVATESGYKAHAAGVVISEPTITDNTLVAVSCFAQRVSELAWFAPFPSAQGRAKGGGFYLGAAPMEDIAAWQRESASFDSGVGVVAMRSAVSLSADSDIEPWEANVWGFQLEEGSSSSSLIETSGAAGTRGGDRLLMPVSDIDPAFFSKPYKQRIIPSFDKGPPGKYITAAGPYIVYLSGSTGNVELYHNGVVASVSVGYFAGDVIDIMVDWVRGGLRVVTASQDITVTFAPGVAPPPADVHIGSTAHGTATFFGTIYPPVTVSTFSPLSSVFSTAFSKAFA